MSRAAPIDRSMAWLKARREERRAVGMLARFARVENVAMRYAAAPLRPAQPPPPERGRGGGALARSPVPGYHAFKFAEVPRKRKKPLRDGGWAGGGSVSDAVRFLVAMDAWTVFLEAEAEGTRGDEGQRSTQTTLRRWAERGGGGVRAQRPLFVAWKAGRRRRRRPRLPFAAGRAPQSGACACGASASTPPHPPHPHCSSPNVVHEPVELL